MLPFYKWLCGWMVVLFALGVLPVFASTITVTNTNDSGAGSLRQAIVDAVSGDTINFAVAGAITLTSGELVINKNLTITGPGAVSLAISGNHASRVFHITAGTSTISGVTIQAGTPALLQGGGILIEHGGTLTLSNCTLSSNHAGDGGGIWNGGTLTVTNSMLSGNSANSGGGGIFNGNGLTVTNSTLSGNSAVVGGGIFNGLGTLTLTNSTLSGNSATRIGGGIFNDSASATMTNSTVAGNSAGFESGGIWILHGNVTLKNTLLANGPSGGNCRNFGGVLTSLGHNLSDDATCASFFTQPGDLNSTNPQLDPAGLKDNGGPTKTIALPADSPAVNAIPVSDCKDVAGNPIATDQRGVARPQGPACDIGAFEASVIQTNRPPLANAGPDQTGIVKVALTFDGSASSDPDGAIVSYQWNFGDGGPTALGARVSHAYSAAGTYTATLTVTDNGGLSASDTAQVTIQTPAQATQSLISTVQALRLPQGTRQSLVAKLQAALATINRNDRQAKLAAINQLQAFIHEVRALQGVRLTPQQAASLTIAAQQIMQSLSGSP